MLQRTQIDVIIKDLAKTLGEPSLTLEEDGSLELVFDGKIRVRMIHEPEEGVFWMLTDLGRLPSDPAEGTNFRKHLLSRNETAAQEGGPIYAVDHATNVAILMQAIDDFPLGYPSFEKLLLSQVEQAEKMMGELEAAAKLAVSEKDDPLPDSSFTVINL